jgi:hypothetical protein
MKANALDNVSNFISYVDSVIFKKGNSHDKNETTSIEDLSVEHFKYAIRLNIPVELVNDLSLFSFLNEWFRTKYVFGGNSKKGIDCSGFTQQLYKQVYCKELARVVGGQFNQCIPIDKSELIQGDLVFFETFRPGLSHVGFYIGDNKFIHAAVNSGVTIDDLDNPYYKKAYRKAGRVILN